MLFTTEGEREQVFGWAFQGSITAPLIARINQAMGQDHIPYAVSRFSRLGGDDIAHGAEMAPERCASAGSAFP